MRARRMMGDERRDQIARAVMSLAAEEGVHAISIAAVARRIGVTPSALYRHYPSKDAMLSATLDRMSERMEANLERARSAAGDPVKALEQLLMLQVELIRESRGLPFIVLSEGFGGNAAHRDTFHTMIERFRTRLAALFLEAQRTGAIRDDIPAENLAVSFIGLYVPPAILWNVSRGHFDITSQVRRSWIVFYDGIRSTPGESPRKPRRARTPRVQEKRT